MRVRLSSVLRSYTNGLKEVIINGSTVSEVIDNLDKEYSGIKFRFINEQGKIREHMNLFLNKELVEDMTIKVTEDDELFIVQSLSGGI